MFADRIYGLSNCLIIFNNNYEDQGQRNGREMIALLAENP